MNLKTADTLASKILLSFKLSFELIVRKLESGKFTLSPYAQTSSALSFSEIHLELTKDVRRPLRLRGFESKASWVNQRNDRYRHTVLEVCLRAAISNLVVDLKLQSVQVGDAITPCRSLQASHHVLIFW